MLLTKKKTIAFWALKNGKMHSKEAPAETGPMYRNQVNKRSFLPST